MPIRIACSKSDEGKKLLGDYDNRIGQMGEFAFMEAVKAACQEIPEHPILIVTAFDVRKSLWEKKINGTKKIGALKTMNLELEEALKDVEHDTLVVVPNGDKLNVLCCQAKVVQHGDEEEISKKVAESLEQAVKDVRCFLAILPDLTPNQIAHKIIFKLFSVLPVTSQESLSNCKECKKNIIFREDIRSGAVENPTSVPEDLYQSITLQNSIKSHPSLRSKLGLYNLSPPSQEVEKMFKKISARYVGVGSLFPTKDRKSLLKRIISQLDKMEYFGKKGFPHLNQLSPEQMSAIQVVTEKGIPKMIIRGMYGAGKTVVLEYVIQKVRETVNNPYIYLVAWEESKLLMARFREHFPESSGVKVMSGDELCKKFGIFQEQYRHEKRRDAAINLICRKLEEECPSDHQPILLIDELPPNTDGWNALSGDWRGLESGKVGLVLSLMPKADERANSTGILDIIPPPDMPVITLNRAYRYTHRIFDFLKFLMKNSTSQIHSPLSFPLHEVTYGNEVYGELPEVLFLKEEVDLSLSSAEDLLAKNKEVLLGVLDRFELEDKVTILVDTCVVEEELEGCKEWLEREIVRKGHHSVKVATRKIRIVPCYVKEIHCLPFR